MSMSVRWVASFCRRPAIWLSSADVLICWLSLMQTVERFEIGHKSRAALNKTLSALLDLEVNAEKLWGVARDAVRDCTRGAAVTAETLRAAIGEADSTGVRDEAIRDSAEQLLLESVSVEAESVAELTSITDASEETVQKARALVERAQHYPLSAAAAKSVAQRSRVVAAVLESHRLLAADHTDESVMSDRDMHALRELRTSIEHLSQAQLEGPEPALLESVREAILLHSWRSEVRYMRVHPTTPAAAEAIRQHGEGLGAAAQATNEWEELTAELARFEAFQHDARVLLDEVDESKAESKESWLGVGSALAERVKALRERDAQLRVKNTTTSHALTEVADLLTLTLSAQDRLTNVRAVMAALTAEAPPVMDIREVTMLANQLGQAAEKHSSFVFLRSLAEEMHALHLAAANWTESATALLPQKATRNKAKTDAAQATAGELVSALMEPIARAVTTPMHEKLQATLAQAKSFREQLTAFLLPAERSLNDPSDYQAPEFAEKLHEDIKTIAEIKKTGEAIPLELPEMRVVQWVSALFAWMADIPYPGDDPKQHAIPLDAALRKIEESQPIVGTIPGNVIETLCSLNAMNFDASRGPVGFHSDIHPNLNLAGDLSDHLEKQVKLCQELQERLNVAVDTRRPSVEVLQQLQQEFAALLVQPSPQSRRTLDKALGKSASRASLTAGLRQKVGDIQDSESSEYSGDEGEEEEEGLSYWKDRSEGAPAGKGAKRARDGTLAGVASGDSLLSAVGSKRAPSAEVKVKAEDKTARKTKQCANPNCPTRAAKLKSSAYCSNTCAFVAAPLAFQSLLAYRKLLCIYGAQQQQRIQVEDPSQNLLKVSSQDWKAYALNVPPVNDSVAEIVAGMKSAGMVAETYVSGREHSRPGDKLDTLLVEEARRVEQMRSSTGAKSPRVPEGAATQSTAPTDKKTNYLQSMLMALPPAAGPVLLKGDTEGLAVHTAAVKAVGSTPVPQPASKTATAAGAGAAGTQDEDLRVKVRYGLEELLEKTLTRLNVPGAVAHAAFIALEFEEELCLKYASAEARASRKAVVFDKKEYRKHYLMLVSNLRKPHNDQLVSVMLPCVVIGGDYSIFVECVNDHTDGGDPITMI